MLAANTIRQTAEEENLSCKIGFFLHIPFPSFDIVKVFPWVDMIIQVSFGWSFKKSTRFDFTLTLILGQM